MEDLYLHLFLSSLLLRLLLLVLLIIRVVVDWDRRCCLCLWRRLILTMSKWLPSSLRVAAVVVVVVVVVEHLVLLVLRMGVWVVGLMGIMRLLCYSLITSLQDRTKEEEEKVQLRREPSRHSSFLPLLPLLLRHSFTILVAFSRLKRL